MIERQKRIAERSAACAHNPATTKRASKENKTSIVSMKNEKPKLQSPEEATEKLRKPVLKTSTIDRLASAKVTHKFPSNELKSSQPKKAISKASGTENKKPGTERVKPLDKKESLSNSNGLLSAAPGAKRKTDSADPIVALPASEQATQPSDAIDDSEKIALPTTEQATQPSDAIDVSENIALPATEQATQPYDAIDDSGNIEELHRMSTIEKNGDKDLLGERLEDKKSCGRNSPKGNFSMPIQDHPDQLEYVKGDNASKTASNGRAYFSPEVTVHFFPSSPKKALNAAVVHIDENNVVNKQFSVSPGISVVQVATPQDETTAPNPSRKKWNSGEHSPKAVKGFRKLLFFGRKTRN